LIEESEIKNQQSPTIRQSKILKINNCQRQ